MLLRLNSLARGLSGVRAEVLDRLLALLNRGLVPRIPEQGSVGASGDLAPLAHLALAMTGEGAFVDERTGAVTPARDVLRDAGIEPLVLAEKEGVALLNGTSLMAAYLALGVADARELLDAATVAAAVSFDALLGSPESLDDRLGEIRNSPDHRELARVLRTLLHGSRLSVAHETWTGQDPYTLRCLPQVLGAVRLAIGFAEGVALRELNAVTDNPVVFEPDEFVNGGNFHGQPLALALDTLALAVQYIAGFSERRVVRLVDPSLSRGLPPFLAPEPGFSTGFMVPQYARRGPRERERNPRPPGEFHEPFDLGRPGGLRQHGPLGGCEAVPRPREHPPGGRDRMDRRRSGARASPPRLGGKGERGGVAGASNTGGALGEGPKSRPRHRTGRLGDRLGRDGPRGPLRRPVLGPRRRPVDQRAAGPRGNRAKRDGVLQEARARG